MRDDVRMMRATLAMDSVGGSGGVSSSYNYDQYSTHNQATFTAKPMREITMGRTAIHKNISQLPGFDDPPSGAEHFVTTNSVMFGQSYRPVSVGSTRHLAVFKKKCQREQTDIFGTRGVRRPKPETEATAQGRSTLNVARTYQPRLVHGGAYRNKSRVGLDMTEGTGEQDFSTTQQEMSFVTGRSTPAATHRFNLPQKNTSTFLTTSLEVGPDQERPRPPKTSYGRTNNAQPLTETDYRVSSQQNYKQLARRGKSHYETSHESQFRGHPDYPLVVPPGKGGVDQTYSKVPLGDLVNAHATGIPHSVSIHAGDQLLDGLRATCPSRGSLGARGGGRMARPAF